MQPFFPLEMNNEILHRVREESAEITNAYSQTYHDFFSVLYFYVTGIENDRLNEEISSIKSLCVLMKSFQSSLSALFMYIYF